MCWESTEVLRFGFDRPIVRLRHPSTATLRFIDALRSGIASNDLATIARRVGITTHERRTLLAELAPALLKQAVPDAPAPSVHGPIPVDQAVVHHVKSPPLVSVMGNGHASHETRAALERAGAIIAPTHERTQFAVVVEHFLQPANQAQPLLRYEIPHLLVRLTDQSVIIGPLVLQGGSPCLACLELHGLERDPLAPVLAAQLIGRTPATDTTVCAALVALHATLVFQHTMSGSPALASTRLRFAVTNGTPTLIPRVESVPTHPACGCVSLSTHAAGPPSTSDAHPSLGEKTRRLPSYSSAASAA